MATEKSLQILEQIKSLTILELSDLVKAVEEEFGVSAAAPVAVAGAAGAAAPGWRGWRRPGRHRSPATWRWRP